MKVSRYFKLLLIILTFVCTLPACSKGRELTETEKKIIGSWAYIHDKETEIASFSKDGKAVYDGKEYNFECDDTYITLTGDSDTVFKVRYQLDGENIYLFKYTEYSYDGTEEPEGIVGCWKNEKGWSFEFTAQGTFLEDGYFPGNYTQNKDDQTCKLMYSDQYEDTVIYYTLQGSKLYIDYPWKCVKTQKEK